MSDIDQARLERIENKLDKLGDALAIMARVEEKIVTLNQARIDSNQRYDLQISGLSEKIEEISKKQIEQDKIIFENTRINGYIKWVIGIVITAIVGAISLRFF